MQKNSPEKTSLKQTLIEAGLQLLHENGEAGLTLRKCAARAKVSHAAPAHHFKKIEGLLTAIAASGYEKLSRKMREALNTSSTMKDEQKLRAICNAYIAFSAENEALYKLMFSSEKIDFSDSGLGPTSQKAFNILRETCAPFKEQPNSKLTLEITIWSMLHGFCDFASNCKENANHPAYGISFDQMLDQMSFTASNSNNN